MYPVVNLPPVLNTCPHNAVTLDAGAPADSYLWSTGDTTQTISVINQGLYIVTVANATCATRDSTTLNVYPDISWEENATLCNVDKYTLDPGITNATYFWSNGANTPTIDITEPGEYWVIANSNGCLLSDTITINGNIGNGALWFPNSFTPNSNGLNDSFTGKGSDITYFDLMIFNRWGDLIFETDKQEVGWDGMYKGRLAEQDVYVWKVKYKTLCSKDQLITKIGHVTLIQ
jgi:gliding motility-associated-like protein